MAVKLTRRTFLKVTGATSAAAVAGRPSAASAASVARSTPAVLVDTTKCVGCRACEAACAEANHLSGPVTQGEETIFASRRTTDERTFTVVNRVASIQKVSTTAPRATFVKTQCMHCVDPGCASACPAAALQKTPEGPVVYHEERCLGCRYCMVACPFEMPKYEYTSAAPYVRKCSFCATRQAQGLAPACTTVCPSGALTFGTRTALLEEARHRLYGTNGHYVPHIYGEHEAGGTSWLYIADRPLEEIGFRGDIPQVASASLAEGALSVVPLILTMWPPLLMGLYSFTQRRQSPPDGGHDAGATGNEETHHA